MTQLRHLKAQVKEAQKNRVEIIQIDESIFQPNDNRDIEWAPKGKPFCKSGRFTSVKYEAVLGAISDQRGFIAAKFNGPNPYYGEDIQNFFKELKMNTPWPIVILMDNARIHTSRACREFYLENDIQTIQTLPYRPDTMGIEDFWRILKHKYRPRVRQHFVKGETWDQERLIR